MRKYTFIAEYKGGTYISQYSAFDINQALLLWANGLEKKYFSAHKKLKIIEELKYEYLHPVRINTLENVWCANFLSGKYFLLLNIVETVAKGDISQI